LDRFQGVLTEANLTKMYLRMQTQPDKDALIFYKDCFDHAQLIQENESFEEVVKKLMTAVGNRAFVIDASGKVVGHLTIKDILPYLSDKMGEKSHHDIIRSQLYMYESFFDKSPFLMHSVNSDGVIQMGNEILHAFLGYTYGDLIGKTIFDLYPKENHKKAQEGLRTIMDQGFHEVIQGKMVHKEGHALPVELVSRALVDQNRNPIGTITVSRPTDMKALLQVLPEL
jgi:PAS domain S-box-containing protein